MICAPELLDTGTGPGGVTDTTSPRLATFRVVTGPAIRQTGGSASLLTETTLIIVGRVTTASEVILSTFKRAAGRTESGTRLADEAAMASGRAPEVVVRRRLRR